MHPQLSSLRALAEAIAKETDSVFGYLTDGCNAAGAWLAGAVPHRGTGGVTEDVVTGMNLAEMNKAKLAACLLVNIEPDTDALDAKALMASLADTDFVVSISSYNSASLKQVADVLLPAAAFTETSGTYVNAEGFWQSFKGAVEPKGEARPAWKILRVLGNLTGAGEFEYMSSDEVKAEVRSQCESIQLSNDIQGGVIVDSTTSSDLFSATSVPMYAEDAITRRAASLQRTVDAETLCVRLNSAEADRLGVAGASMVNLAQKDGLGDDAIELALVIDDTVPDACAWLPSALEGNDLLGAVFAEVSIESTMSEAKGA